MNKSGQIIWWSLALLVFVVSLEGGAGAGQARPRSRLVGYVGGKFTYKVDFTSRRVVAEGYIPGAGDAFPVATFLWMGPDATRVYATGTDFSSVVVGYNTRTLDITAELTPVGRTTGVVRPGRFTSEDGFQGSADGKVGVVFFTNLREAESALQFVSLPELKPMGRLDDFQLSVGRRSVFTDDGRKLIALRWLRDPEAPPPRVMSYFLAVIDVQSATVERQARLPWPLKGTLSAGQFLPEAQGLYLAEAGEDYWLLPGRQKEYVYRFVESPRQVSVVVAEVTTGRVLHRHQIPISPDYLNAVTLTPDGKQIVLSRGPHRVPRKGEPADLTILDRVSGKVVGRIPVKWGATSNVVFRYE